MKLDGLADAAFYVLARIPRLHNCLILPLGVNYEAPPDCGPRCCFSLRFTFPLAAAAITGTKLATPSDTSSDSLTERVSAAIFELSNTLGAEFLEKVYQRALPAELRLRGIHATTEASFPVKYKGHLVGDYFAGLPIANVLIVELKRTNRLLIEHTANASIASKHPTGPLPLINFQNQKQNGKESPEVLNNLRPSARIAGK